MIRRFFGSFLLWIWGWRVEGEFPPVPKCVVVEAPHTSFYDFFLGRFAMWKLGIPTHYLIKAKYFKGLMGLLLKWSGGIPVTHNPKDKFYQNLLGTFKEAKNLYLVITPEGTRKPVKRWRSGFIAIARDANVPLVLGYCDYSRKVIGIMGPFEMSDDMAADIDKIQRMYKASWARHPEKFYELPPIELKENLN